MAKFGEKPGKGSYRCNKCGKIVILENDNEVLPRCPKCGYSEFTKVG